MKASSSSLLVLSALLVSAVAQNTVTLYDIKPPPPTQIQQYESMIGASPIAVDEDGHTFYVVSRVRSAFPGAATSRILTTETWTFRADATRVIHEWSTEGVVPSQSAGSFKNHGQEECVYDDDLPAGARAQVKCVNKGVQAYYGEDGQGITTTIWSSFTGEARPWVTVTHSDGENLPTQTAAALLGADESPSGGAGKAIPSLLYWVAPAALCVMIGIL